MKRRHRTLHFWIKKNSITFEQKAAKEQFFIHICQTMHGAKVSRLRNLCTRIFGASCNLFCVLPTNRRSKGYDYDSMPLEYKQ